MAKSCATCTMRDKDNERCWTCLAAQELGEHLPYWTDGEQAQTHD